MKDVETDAIASRIAAEARTETGSERGAGFGTGSGTGLGRRSGTGPCSGMGAEAVAAEVLAAGLTLGIFDALSGGSACIEDLASATSTPPAEAARLLAALETMGFVRRTGGPQPRYANSPLAEVYMVRGAARDFRRRLDTAALVHRGEAAA